MHLPAQHALEADLRQIKGLGANTVHIYHVPPRSFLDTVSAFGLRSARGRALVEAPLLPREHAARVDPAVALRCE